MDYVCSVTLPEFASLPVPFDEYSLSRALYGGAMQTFELPRTLVVRAKTEKKNERG